MAKIDQQLRDIRLGAQCWCVLKTSVVDPEKKDRPEYLIHIAKGYVQSKGVQHVEGGKPLLFVEVAGQRIKANHVFKTAAQAISKAEQMMGSMADGLKALPPQS